MYPAPNIETLLEFEDSLKKYIESVDQGQIQGQHFLSTDRTVSTRIKVAGEQENRRSQQKL